MKKIFFSKEVMLMVLVLTLITFGVTVFSTYLDYNAAKEQKKITLQDLANRQKLIIEDLHDYGMSKDSILETL